MKYAYIIEDDPKIFGELKTVLGQLDPQLGIRNYPSLQEFVKWLQLIVEQKRRLKAAGVAPVLAPAPTTGAAPPAAETPAAGESTPATSKSPTSVQPEETVEIVLMIIKAEFMKHRGFHLLQKTRDYFISNGLCTKELPTNFVVTAFDEGEFDFSKYENQVVSNILFKPFDLAILKEHLGVALSGGKPNKSGELYRQKTTSRIEMLKDVPLEELTEIGFMSSSDRELKPGAMSKYYSPYFQSGKLSSIYAKLRSCTPSKTQKGYFDCELSFFGVLPAQLSVLRKLIRTSESHVVDTFEPPKKVVAKPAQQSGGGPPPKEAAIKVGPGAKPAAKGGEAGKKDGAPPVEEKPTVNFLFLISKESENVMKTVNEAFGNAKCVEYNEFATFALEIDPLGKSLEPTKSKDKPLPFALKGKFFLDLKESKIMMVDPAPTESSSLFGLPLKPQMGQEAPFLKKIFADDRNRWLAMMRDGIKPEVGFAIYRFRMPDNRLVFFKFTKYGKVKHEKLGEVTEVEVAECSDMEKKDFLNSLSLLPKVIHGIVIEKAYIGENPSERWNTILGLLKDRAAPEGIKIFALTDPGFNIDDLVEKQAPIEDLFVKPFDSPYIIKRFMGLYKGLELREPVEKARMPLKDFVKAAQPVLAQEVGEAGVSLNYYRPIAVGSFRKIVLWIPHEVGLPEFLASCNAVVEVEENKQKRYICHFIFFGVRDRDLKHIRTWIKDYYVHQKEGEQ